MNHLYFTRLNRLMTHAVVLALLGLTLLATTGCQTRFPSERVPKVKWLIMPFEQPPAMKESPTAIRGWWLGAYTIRQNSRAGVLLADMLSRKMAPLDFLHLYSSIEIRYYFGDKRKLLKDKFPQLNDAQVDDLIRQVPNIEFGRELGADKILSGHIRSQYMAENRTIHWWWATLTVECQVTDVVSGKVEWNRTYNLHRQLASQSTLQELLADRLVHDLEEDYFRPRAKP